jgi:beta-glucosidase
LVDEAVALAQSRELVVLFLGLPSSYEAEGRDRTTIELPADQVTLVKAVGQVNVSVIVALSNGSAVTTADWRDAVGGIIEFWLTGQAHGDSIVDVLLGEVNPSGKLAETVPVQLEDTSSYLDFPGELGHVRHSEGIHVGYRWFDARRLDVDYPFGHGLSYTTFDYTDLHITVGDLDDLIAMTVSMTLTNTGNRSGAEVVQVYVGDRSGVLQMPERELRAFSKVHVEAGGSERVELPIARPDLEHFHPRRAGSSLADPCRCRSDPRPGISDCRRPSTYPGTPWRFPLQSGLGWAIGGRTRSPDLPYGSSSRSARHISDLLSDPVSQDSALMFPLISITQFPGFPVSAEEAQELSSRL